jgi:selenocysteine-specific elongation factor
MLWERLQVTQPRPNKRRPRLPVDRVFSLPGFGTVVTGTLLDGRFRTGDQIEVQPPGHKGRIRGLQTHKTKRDVVQPGSRVAVNLTGVSRDEIKRGDVVSMPGTIRGTILVDATYRHLPNAGAPLKHNMEVKLFVGATEVVAHTRVPGEPQIQPGQDGWLQLALSAPVAVVRGDHFILRRPSPGATLGGGQVLDPYPGRRHRRFRPGIVERLQTLAQGSPAELLLQVLSRLEPTTQSELFKQAGLDEGSALLAMNELELHDQIIRLGQQLMSQVGWQQRLDQSVSILAKYHEQFPLRLGIAREELRSRLKLSPAVFNPLLDQAAEEGLLAEAGILVHLPAHEIRFTPQQQSAIDRLMARFARAGITSPSIKEAKVAVGDDVYFALVDLRKLRPISGDVVYAQAEYKTYTGRILSYLQEHESINAAQARDLLGTSRKYAISLLEHLDELKLTRRVGDDRQLVQ